ncbi:MAG: hypothetical protein HY238_07880 [Acidobacteria bacterium]|nr:hypothetical protein [Acidobacteriota bacterium]
MKTSNCTRSGAEIEVAAAIPPRKQILRVNPADQQLITDDNEEAAEQQPPIPDNSVWSEGIQSLLLYRSSVSPLQDLLGDLHP